MFTLWCLYLPKQSPYWARRGIYRLVFMSLWPLLLLFKISFSLWPSWSCGKCLNSIMGKTWAWAMKRWRAYSYQQNQACRPGEHTHTHLPSHKRTIIMYGNIDTYLFVCSLTVRPGGDDGLGKVERTPSIHLSVAEHGPLETSTPQGDDQPSSLFSQASANTVPTLTFFWNCNSYAC